MIKSALLETVRHYAEHHKMTASVTDTALPGVSIVRAQCPGGLVHAIYKPLVCLILQGGKRVTMGSRVLQFEAGNSLIVTADTPTISQITHASHKEPYLAIIIELEPAIIAELDYGIAEIPGADRSVLQSDSTDAEMADTACRMMQLLERPAAVPMLMPFYRRELHYWLLLGKHGFLVKRYTASAGNTQEIGHALAILHKPFAEALSVRDLASAAGMSTTSFHYHFREATASTPLQFQKKLRLIEARRLMLSEGWNASSAAFEVGYESVNQFTREYGRVFGAPPARDIRAAKNDVSPPAAAEHTVSVQHAL